MREYNVYCDESCHLEHDGQPIMLLGALWCPESETRRLAREVADLKSNGRATGELKWSKVSKSRLDFYEELVDWFLAEEDAHFRALVVLAKERLNHDYFNQGSHDTFYYKMYFSLLREIIDPLDRYNIYLDVKDTRSQKKLKTLHEILCNDRFDFTSQMIRRLQNVRSHESHLLQVADFLLGAVAYRHRQLRGNAAKLAVIDRLETGLGRSLLGMTPRYESKFNIFLFTPSDSAR